MAVDKQPAVGRILLVRGRSTDFFPWYLKGGKITRVAGQRAYYTRPDGSESFTHEYSAVVDTEEEETALLQFTDKYQAKLSDLHAEMTRMSKDLVDSLNAKVSTKRTRRST